MNFFMKLYKVSRTLLSNIFQKKLNVLSSEQTIDLILKYNLSIGRYGDGEIGFIDGKGIGFQPYNEELAQKLTEVKTTDKFLVCIPNVFSKKAFNKKILTKKEYNAWWKYRLLNGYLWKKHFLKNDLIGDAFVSRFYLRYKNAPVLNYLAKIKKLWQDKDVVFVEGAKSRLGYKNDLFSNAKTIRRILCPSVNAFSCYDEILTFIQKNIENSALLILAIGPTATVMAYELSKVGYQALDLGHIDIEYEWFLMGAKDKVKIKHKYVNEMLDGRNPEDVDDIDYKNQIICNFEKGNVE